MKFSALNIDFNSPSLDPLASRKPVHSSMRYPPKSCYVTPVGSSSAIQLQIDINLLLTITKTADELIKDIDLE